MRGAITYPSAKRSIRCSISIAIESLIQPHPPKFDRCFVNDVFIFRFVDQARESYSLEDAVSFKPFQNIISSNICLHYSTTCATISGSDSKDDNKRLYLTLIAAEPVICPHHRLIRSDSPIFKMTATFHPFELSIHQTI